MKDRISRTHQAIVSLRQEVSDLIGECRKHDGREWVHAQVDLGHAEHELSKAQSFVNRLLVNGQKPWDTPE